MEVISKVRALKTTISSRGPGLEACLQLPGKTGPFPGVVLCHPHPLYGGNMDNNIILSVSKSLSGRGIASLRFNFRGVGNSKGQFGNGLGEKEDALAALEYLAGHEAIDKGRIGIAGYSFGGMVAMGAGSQSSAVRAIAAISPVIDPGVLKGCTKPKFIVCGSKDHIVNTAAVEREVAAMADPKDIEIIPGADHFWYELEEMVASRVMNFFADILI
ncbi:MAG: alpha/beta hydrolase [Desulfocucumaceae bacterium]